MVSEQNKGYIRLLLSLEDSERLCFKNNLVQLGHKIRKIKNEAANASPNMETE